MDLVNTLIVSSGAIALGQNILKSKKKIKLEIGQAIVAVPNTFGWKFKLFDKFKVKSEILISPDDTSKKRALMLEALLIIFLN